MTIILFNRGPGLLKIQNLLFEADYREEDMFR